MALMQVSENDGGDFLPIVKYDARAGRFFRVDKGDGISTPVDITRQFKAIFDFASVEVGYILFSAGGAPVFDLVPYGQPMPARPASDAKPGIRMHIKLSKECGGDVREVAGTSKVFLRGINLLHDEYLKLAPSQPGKLPVVVLTDTIPVESGGGAKRSTNYQPTFSIQGWAPRPADMPVSTGASTGVDTRPAKTNGTSHAASNDEMLTLPAFPRGTQQTAANITIAQQEAMDDFG